MLQKLQSIYDESIIYLSQISLRFKLKQKLIGDK